MVLEHKAAVLHPRGPLSPNLRDGTNVCPTIRGGRRAAAPLRRNTTPHTAPAATDCKKPYFFQFRAPSFNLFAADELAGALEPNAWRALNCRPPRMAGFPRTEQKKKPAEGGSARITGRRWRTKKKRNHLGSRLRLFFVRLHRNMPRWQLQSRRIFARVLPATAPDQIFRAQDSARAPSRHGPGVLPGRPKVPRQEIYQGSGASPLGRRTASRPAVSQASLFPFRSRPPPRQLRAFCRRNGAGLVRRQQAGLASDCCIGHPLGNSSRSCPRRCAESGIYPVFHRGDGQ